jgi:hypothetical protein
LKATRFFLSAISVAAATCFLGAPAASPRAAQGSPQKPAEKAPESIQEKKQEKPAAKGPPKLPAEIELLETHIRFETDGSSRKEVHARVKINDELGVRQFARLNFDFNRSFEQIEIPLVRITHPSGGIIDVLPSAITDNPNPAVVNAPAYQDVRVKSVRILGLEPGASLEYRVITTVSHHPLAPDFWLDHTFDRSGVVSRELFELDLPASRDLKPFTSTVANDYEIIRSEEGAEARLTFRWKRPPPNAPDSARTITDLPIASVDSDIALTTFKSWADFQVALQKSYEQSLRVTPQLKAKAIGLTKGSGKEEPALLALYDFVSKSIATVDLPLDAAGFRPRGAELILSSGYADPEEKCVLLSALVTAVGLRAQPAFMLSGTHARIAPPIPSILSHPLVMSRFGSRTVWLDPSVEVAPFRVLASKMRGGLAVALYPSSDTWFLEDVPKDLPFSAAQDVKVDAILAADGKLSAKVRYSLRGDNELLLRVAFHKTPKENWKNVAQLLALSDGFRGQITSVTASDPYATHGPFVVEYEITQPKFVDWLKKPVSIPALLPLLGLPDPPTKPATGGAARPIDLGTPLDVEVSATIHLPAGTIAHIPTGTSVARDFATYTSQYSAKDGTLSASRHLNFILKEIPADRAADYNAFLRAVQNDESQVFTLERSDEGAAKPQKP